MGAVPGPGDLDERSVVWVLRVWDLKYERDLVGQMLAQSRLVTARADYEGVTSASFMMQAVAAASSAAIVVISSRVWSLPVPMPAQGTSRLVSAHASADSIFAGQKGNVLHCVGRSE